MILQVLQMVVLQQTEMEQAQLQVLQQVQQERGLQFQTKTIHKQQQ